MAAFGEEAGIDVAISAEALFMTGGFSPDRATALQAEVRRNEVPSVETSIDEDIAAKFLHTAPLR